MASRDAVDLLILGALWGASFLFMRIAAPEFGPIPLIFVRVAIAAMLLALVLWHRGLLTVLVRQQRPLIVLGVINTAVPFTLFAYAALTLPAKIRIKVLDPIHFDVEPDQPRYSRSRIMDESERIRTQIQEAIYDMLRARKSVWFG